MFYKKREFVSLEKKGTEDYMVWESINFSYLGQEKEKLMARL